jgi:hypothetical protein
MVDCARSLAMCRSPLSRRIPGVCERGGQRREPGGAPVEARERGAANPRVCLEPHKWESSLRPACVSMRLLHRLPR